MRRCSRWRSHASVYLDRPHVSDPKPGRGRQSCLPTDAFGGVIDGRLGGLPAAKRRRASATRDNGPEPQLCSVRAD